MKVIKKKISLYWFRRDLRLEDNTALFHALSSGFPVLLLFIFDDNILDKLAGKEDKRVDLIYQLLENMQKQLIQSGKGICLKKGNPVEIMEDLLQRFDIQGVYVNMDYEPYARKRDLAIENLFRNQHITFHSFKDQVIFDRHEVMKADMTPYTVFTPYANRWKQKLRESGFQSFPSEKCLHQLADYDSEDFFSMKQTGFTKTEFKFEAPIINTNIISQYHQNRDFPDRNGTSGLSLHLRFGSISIRKLVTIALEFSETWLNELIWREFFMMILWHFPRVENQAFKLKYETIPWRFDEKEFDNWCTGNTGYPIVDAGMRELNATGLMHNRIRMITANFLTKLMLHDRRLGEAYFAEKLLDFDLAANNGNWQWSAGCGCEAAPYFRIFNPDEQIRKFDPDFRYIRKWIPEIDTPAYPVKMINYSESRERALKVYKKALNEFQ